ncbi:MAG: flap endonuclease [Polyangiaceae bacterium]|nr:flap endonuclease [Polyangiaceae bacterium]
MHLHVVDGTFELFRAHFTRRPGHSVLGRDLKATVGLMASMLALLHDDAEAVSHVAIAFDNPIRSVRNDWFDGYKTDEGVPYDLAAQFDIAEEAARALGMTVWSMDRYEADDALATAATRFAARATQVRLLTPDKDLWQSLRGGQVVLVDRVRARVIDEAALWAARGLRPASVPDWLALVGDTADGIPGLAGFGEKTAAALLNVFHHLDAIPLDPKQWPPDIRQADRLAETLAREMPRALLYRKLATLIDDVPLPEDLDDLAWQGVPREAFEAFCDRVEARTLRARPTRWASG